MITGGPGTGKTTIINCILELLPRETEVALCAPTGRAAKRMTEATGTEAKTIHRLLEYGGAENVFSRDESNPLEAGCIIADEEKGDEEYGIAPGTKFEDLPDDFECPLCGVGKDEFEIEE